MGDIDPLSPSGKIPPPPPTPKIDEEENMSPFKRMLGPSATKEQVSQFINQWVNNIIAEMRKSDKKWKESMKRMREGE